MVFNWQVEEGMVMTSGAAGVNDVQFGCERRVVI